MVTYSSTPVLVDAFLVDFNTEIIKRLTWLSNPLGKIQPITKEVGGRMVKVPAMHADSGEYIEVYPSDTLANMSWFDIGESIPIGRSKFKVSAEFNMFLNLNKIYPLVTASRDLENVKSDVFLALKNLSLSSGAIVLKSISENYDDVYQGYALPGLQDKYFMQPYAGLNFSLDLYIRNTNIICT